MKTFRLGQQLPPNIRFFNIPYGDEGGTRTITKEVIKNNYYGAYECKHLSEKRIVRLEECGTCQKGKVPEPSLMKSNFAGCPHWYGKIYTPDGRVLEVQQKMTERFIAAGRRTGGDWTGYRAGEYTNRFLSEDTLMEAFELLKEILIDEK